MLKSKYREQLEKSCTFEHLEESAFRTCEAIDINSYPALKYNDPRAPLEQISIDAYAEDIAGYWRLHERKLWAITAFCLLYLAMKLFGG